ncbi:MAG: enoyl-CoA hydratase/isomerase family protein [Acidobacteriota bacterium]
MTEGPEMNDAVSQFGDLRVTVGGDHVATAEICRPPHNFFDKALIGQIADALETLDEDAACRAVVLCSEGKNFCAGADFSGSRDEEDDGVHLYDEAVRLFSTKTPVVAAVQGAAVGGGFGLSLFADFRVACPEARFTANFARLGFHHGFGLTVTLPALVGQQRALEMLYTGQRLKGRDAYRIGLCDRFVEHEDLRAEAHALALEIARSAPLAVRSIRETHRGDLPNKIRAATDREKAEQDRLRQTEDFREGVKAMSERRLPDFQGR